MTVLVHAMLLQSWCTGGSALPSHMMLLLSVFQCGIYSCAQPMHGDAQAVTVHGYCRVQCAYSYTLPVSHACEDAVLVLLYITHIRCALRVAVVQQLEKLNPTPRPLESPYLNGQWRLVRAASALHNMLYCCDSCAR